MDKLLQILLKERNLKFQEEIAEEAEKFTAMGMGAQHSSVFQLALAECLAKELEERNHLYITNMQNADVADFRKFHSNEEKLLRDAIFARFGKGVSGQERCEIIREKYECFLHSQPKAKEPIGFHM